MCRHLAWLGEPRSVSSLVLEPEHGLLRQSYQPRRQSHGLMNADGWGVGFLAPHRDEPVRWRSSRPLWSDASFASVAPELRSGRVLAAVRSATAGMPLDETAAAPFTDGVRLLSHNGRVQRSVLPPYAEAESVCDSAVLAAHVFAGTKPGEDADALAALVLDVAALDPTARLSLLVVEDDRVLGVSWGDGLSYLEETDGPRGPRGIVLASEPYDDDPRWVDVPDGSLVEVTTTGVSVSALVQAVDQREQ
jgi:glutamine amidotransferase